MKSKIKVQIEKIVSNYRQAAKSLRDAKREDSVTPQFKRAMNMIMDRASGALDALYEIDPKNPAWTETGWIS